MLSLPRSSLPGISRVLALLLLPLAAAPAYAGTPYYDVKLSAAVAQDRIIARELLWSCSGDRCVAAKSNSRPAIICSAVAKAAGGVTEFSAGGKKLDQAALAACNKSAS